MHGIFARRGSFTAKSKYFISWFVWQAAFQHSLFPTWPEFFGHFFGEQWVLMDSKYLNSDLSVYFRTFAWSAIAFYVPCIAICGYLAGEVIKSADPAFHLTNSDTERGWSLKRLKLIQLIPAMFSAKRDHACVLCEEIGDAEFPAVSIRVDQAQLVVVEEMKEQTFVKVAQQQDRGSHCYTHSSLSHSTLPVSITMGLAGWSWTTEKGTSTVQSAGGHKTHSRVSLGSLNVFRF